MSNELVVRSYDLVVYDARTAKDTVQELSLTHEIAKVQQVIKEHIDEMASVDARALSTSTVLSRMALLEIKELVALQMEVMALKQGHTAKPTDEEVESVMNAPPPDMEEFKKQEQERRFAAEQANKSKGGDIKAVYRRVVMHSHSDRTKDPFLLECFDTARQMLTANDLNGLLTLEQNIKEYKKLKTNPRAFREYLHRRRKDLQVLNQRVEQDLNNLKQTLQYKMIDHYENVDVPGALAAYKEILAQQKQAFEAERNTLLARIQQQIELEQRKAKLRESYGMSSTSTGQFYWTN